MATRIAATAGWHCQWCDESPFGGFPSEDEIRAHFVAKHGCDDPELLMPGQRPVRDRGVPGSVYGPSCDLPWCLKCRGNDRHKCCYCDGNNCQRDHRSLDNPDGCIQNEGDIEGFKAARYDSIVTALARHDSDGQPGSSSRLIEDLRTIIAAPWE